MSRFKVEIRQGWKIFVSQPSIVLWICESTFGEYYLASTKQVIVLPFYLNKKIITKSLGLGKMSPGPFIHPSIHPSIQISNCIQFYKFFLAGVLIQRAGNPFWDIHLNYIRFWVCILPHGVFDDLQQFTVYSRQPFESKLASLHNPEMRISMRSRYLANWAIVDWNIFIWCYHFYKTEFLRLHHTHKIPITFEIRFNKFWVKVGLSASAWFDL
jgi:hypothetical protein